MKLTVEFNMDPESLAWYWAEWLYAHSDSPRMPESMDELGKEVGKLLRNLSFGNCPHIPFEMVTKTLESQMEPKSMDELIAELMTHIEGFPEWKED